MGPFFCCDNLTTICRRNVTLSARRCINLLRYCPLTGETNGQADYFAEGTTMKTLALSLVAAALAIAAGANTSPVETAGDAAAPTKAVSVATDGPNVVVVRRRPPALRIEVRTPRPSRRHVWIGGHWKYHRGGFVWVRGHWVVRPHRAVAYVKPTWIRRNGGWVMVGGHWRF